MHSNSVKSPICARVRVAFAWCSINLFAGFVAGPVRAENIDLEINGLEIRLDETNGNIVRLAYPEVGVFLDVEKSAAGLLDLAYPISTFSPLRLAPRFSKAVITREDAGVTIVWDSLSSSRPNLKTSEGKISARVMIRAADDGRSVVLSCRIENHSVVPIPQVLFPDLHGMQPIEGMENTRLRLSKGVAAPFAGPVSPPDKAPFYIDRGLVTYYDDEYYSLHALRWHDYGGYRGGLSMFQKEWGLEHGRSRIRTSRTEADPASLRLLWDYMEEIAPGKTWESGEFWLTPYTGGWAKGIEVYRNWVWQINPLRELPRHIREGIGFQSIWMIQESETDPAQAAFRYAGLLRVSADAKAHGIEGVVLWGWSWFFRIPIPTRDELGTEEEFLTAVREGKALGVNIVPFLSLHNVLAGAVERYGVEFGVGKMANWTYHPDFIPNFQPTYAHDLTAAFVDADHPVWQKDVTAELLRWMDEGVTSFVWDQFKARTEKGVPSGMIELVQHLRKVARVKDPQSTFAGESAISTNLEAETWVLDYTWDWINYKDAARFSMFCAPRV